MNSSNSRSLVIFISEKAINTDAVDDIIDSLQVLYRVQISQEKNLYSLLLQQTSKILFIYLDEYSLRYPRFRQCLLTCVAAKLPLVIVKATDIPNEKVIDYFVYISQRRYNRLKLRLEESIVIDDIQKTLVTICEKVKLYFQPIKRYNIKQTNKDFQISWKLAFETCLQNKKLELVHPVKTTKVYSYNMTSKVSRVSAFKQESKKSYVDDTAINNPKAFPSYDHKKIDRQKKVHRNEHSADKLIHEKDITDGESHVLPKIQISADSKHVDKDEFANSWMNDNENDNSLASYHYNGGRKYSFDYLTKTYAVFDPEAKQDKNLLYIQFPKDRYLLKEEALARRKSYKGTGLRLSFSSSGTEINLDYVPESSFESPIPSPTSNQERFIYKSPLPIFSEETSFPPVELFPCEQLQVRRTSVFDALLEANQ